MIEFIVFILGIAMGLLLGYVLSRLIKPPTPPEPKRVSNRTLDEVVKRYLNELDNKAKDPVMLEIYRKWMEDFVKDETV